MGVSYQLFAAFSLLMVSILVIGENVVAEGETESKQISMRFKDASLDHILEFISERIWLYHCQIGRFGYARHNH